MLAEGIGNTIHLLAAVVWIGGLAILVLGFRPSLKGSVAAEDTRGGILSGLHRRILRLGALSAAVLLGSGLMMMTADEHFEGMGRFENLWSKLMVAKHLVFAAMIGLLALQWRVSRRRADPKAESDLMDVSLMLGVAVLVLTGLLTAVD